MMKSWLCFAIVIAVTWLVLCKGFYVNKHTSAYTRYSTVTCSSSNNIPETKQIIDATLAGNLPTEELGRRLEEKSSTLQRKRQAEQTSLAIATAVGAAGIGGVLGVAGDIAIVDQLDPVVLPVASSVLLGTGSYYVVRDQNNFVSNNLGQLIGNPILSYVTDTKNGIINSIEAKKRSIVEKKDNTVSSIVNFPKTVQRAILNRINNIQNSIKKRVEDKTNEVLNIPNVVVQKVQNKVDETKSKTSMLVKNKVEDIQSIPSKVQNSVSTYAIQKWNMITAFPKNLYNNIVKSVKDKVDEINTNVKSTNDALVKAVDTKLKVVENVTSKLIPPTPKVPPSKMNMDKLDKSTTPKTTESKIPESRLMAKLEEPPTSKATSPSQLKPQQSEGLTQKRGNTIFDQFKLEIKSDNKSKMVKDDSSVKTPAKLTATEDAELKSILNAIKAVDEKPVSISKLANDGNSKNLVNVSSAKSALSVKESESTKKSTTSLSKSPSRSNFPFSLNFNSVKVDQKQESKIEKISASATVAANNNNSTSSAATVASSSTTNKLPFFNSWGYSKSTVNMKSNVTSNNSKSQTSTTPERIVKAAPTPSIAKAPLPSVVATNSGKDKTTTGKSEVKEAIAMKPTSDKKPAATTNPTKSIFSNMFSNQSVTKLATSSVSKSQNLNQKVTVEQQEKITPNILSKAALDQLKSMGLPTKSIVNIDLAMLEYSKGKMTVKEVYAILVAETKSKDQASVVMPNLIGCLPRGTLKSTLNTFYQQQAY